MAMFRQISLYIFIFSSLVNTPLGAQLNLGVGFSAASINTGDHNSILDEYNATNLSGLEKPYSTLNLMTGVYVSLRYRAERVAFEVSWENLERDLQSVLVFDDNTGQVNNLYYNMTSTSIGVENHIRHVGYGAAISSRLFSIKGDIINTDFKRKIDRQREFSTKLYLMYTIQESRLISLQLKPFVQIPLGSYGLSGLEEELQTDMTGLNRTTSPVLFGLTLVFYNGPH